MPITELAELTKLQIKCMQAGMLSYAGMGTLHTDALTGHVSHFHTTLGTTANRLHKQVLARSSKVRWAYIDKDLTVQVCHSFVPYDDSGTAAWIGARGDGIQETTCVKFPQDVFDRVFLTVVPKDKLLGLRSWADNDRLPDSFFSGASIKDTVGPGPLGHDGEAETLPYFAAIPYLHPVLGQVPIGHPVAQPLPDGEYDVAFEGWFAGISFLCLKHDSKSAHVGSSIFAASNWTAGGLGAPIVNGIASGLCERVIEPSVTIMAGGGVACDSLMDEARCDKLRMFTSSLPTETPARAEHAYAGTTPQSAIPVSPDLKYLIKELTEAQSNKDSGINKVATKRAATSWQIFYARPGTDDATGAEAAFVATLSTSFTDVLSEKGLLKTTLMNDAVAAQGKRVKDSRSSVGCHTFAPPGMFDKVLVTIITTFQVMKDCIANHPDDFDSLFSILMLLRIKIGSPSFRNRIATDLAYNNQLQHEEDSTKRKRATTNAYTEGSQLEHGDELVAANNFLLLSMTISDESQHSFVYHAIDNLTMIFETQQCELWLARHCRTKPHIRHVMIMMLQDVLAPFFRLGSNPDLIKLAQDGHNLPLAPFTMAAENAKNICWTINMAFLNNSLGVFEQKPFTFDWFPAHSATRGRGSSVNFTMSSVLGKRDSPALQPRGQDQKRGKPQDGRRDDPRAGGPDRLCDDQVRTSKSKGIFVSSLGPKSPRCMDVVQIGERRSRVCYGYCYVGMFCKFRNCHFAHIDHFKQLNGIDAKKMCKFVAQN